MKNLLTKADILLIFTLLMLSELPLLLTTTVPANCFAEIKFNGTIINRFALTGHIGTKTYDINTSVGHNTVLIQDDTIAVIDTDCPDAICKQTGTISKAGEIIACLPHKLIIEIKGGTPTDDIIDAN